MRQLENVQNDIRRQRPDEVIKSDALPELRKNSTTGKTQVACTYDHDRAVLLQQAAESQMRHRHPGSLGKDLASQIARVFGTPIDLSRLPGFSPDGKRVVTAADDYTARIWDADSGKEIALLKGHTGGMQSAGFSPDGRRVVTASFDNTAHIWDVTWATLVRGDTLRERVCVEKLVGPAQEFTDVELEDPILRGINKDDSVTRNPCLRRGPLSLDYWTRLPIQFWRSLRADVFAN